MKRQLKRLGGMVLFLVGIWLAGRLLWTQLHQLEWAALHIRIEWMLAAFVVNLAYVGLYAQLWVRLADHSGLRLPTVDAYGITFRALAFKYLPVRIAGIGYRLWAYQRYGGWSTARIVAALYGESALVFISAALLLGLSSPWIGWAGLGLGWLPLVGALVLLTGLALMPQAAEWMAERTKWGAKEIRQVAAGARLALSGQFLVRYLAAWLLLGGGLWLTIAALGQGLSGRNLLACLWAYPLAGLAGMVALFAPAGLGVREGVLALALGTILPPGEAALTALAARILILGAEVTAALAGQWLLRGGEASAAA